MVILNALLGLILKVASVYASIYDLVHFITAITAFNSDSNGFDKPFLIASNNFYIICSKDITCFLIEKFGNLFYLISLSIYLIFFYHFDKNFRASFLRLFKDEKKNTKNNAMKNT